MCFKIHQFILAFEWTFCRYFPIFGPCWHGFTIKKLSISLLICLNFERVVEFINLSLNFRATENSKITKTSQNNPVNPQIYQDCLLYPNIAHDIPKHAIITLYTPNYPLYHKISQDYPFNPYISQNVEILSQDFLLCKDCKMK